MSPRWGGKEPERQRRKLDRPGRPKRIVRVCWERLAEPSVREVFNSHLRKSFSQIPREAGDIESEWTMFSASIVETGSSRLWTQGRSLCLLWRQPSNPWWTIDGYRQAKQAAARTVLEAKNFRSGRSSCSAGGELLTSTGDIVGRWKKYFEDLLNPTDLPSNEEAEAGVSEVDSNYRGITLLSLPRKVYARVLERRIRPIVDPRIQEEQCGFRPGRGTLDQLYTLHAGCLRVYGSPHVLCGSGEGIRPSVSLVVFCGGAPCEYGVKAGPPLLRAVRSLYDRSRSLVPHCRCSKSDLFPVHVGLRQGLPFVTDDVVLLASSGQDLQHVLEQVCSRKVKQLQIRGHGSRPEKGGVPSPDWCSVRSYVDASVYRTVVVVKKELSRKAKLSIALPVNLRFPLSPMVMNF
ncbi:hypothetical protein L3Q82_023521, partial [Scortum barcoo]